MQYTFPLQGDTFLWQKIRFTFFLNMIHLCTLVYTVHCAKTRVGRHSIISTVFLGSLPLGQQNSREIFSTII